jgi:hypothetical protein
MKKVLVLAVLFVLIGTSAFAWTCRPGGLFTASGVFSNKPTTLCGILVIADGTNPATVTLYNNKEAASGTLLWPPIVIAAGEYYGGAMFPFILSADQGVYISVSGTGAQVFPYYDAQ